MNATLNTTIALFTALIYTIIIGFGMYMMHYIYGASYGEPEMMYVFWVVEIALTLIALLSAWNFFSWSQIGFGTLQWKQLLWLLPAFALLLLMWVIFFVQLGSVTLTPAQWGLFALAGFTTFLVGFSEELVYRGIVLHAFLRKGRVFVAMLVSVIAFSLLHLVNVFGGLPLYGMIGQLGMTALFGFVFAPLALKLKNLWPLIIFHWLWDFILFVSPLVGADGSIGLLLVVYNIVVGTTLWILLWREQRQSTIHRQTEVSLPHAMR